MPNGDADLCQKVQEAFALNKLDFVEFEMQNATKFSIGRNAQLASILIYSSGKIVVEGKVNHNKEWLVTLQNALEQGGGAVTALLPAEIEQFPTTLRERVPNCDDVVLWFYQEALRCFKAESMAGAAFMLGAASEKAAHLLVDAYCNAITTQEHKEKFSSRIKGRMISQKFDEFSKSYAGCKSRPADPVLTQDLDVLINHAFDMYRHTRNVVGHPQIIPDMDKGVLLANIGNFIVYIQRIYGLIQHFEQNGVQVA